MQLKVSDAIESRVGSGEISGEEAASFSAFVETCNRELMTHAVIEAIYLSSLNIHRNPNQ